ncbi:MAG TPA: YrhK family protein [Gammaproteobacteria bacterium]|nr:YrhK family protein [Gammaproteobacteria bacterium]
MRETSGKQAAAERETLTVTFGHEELVIHHRYEVLSILNDFCIAVWFLVGSIFFLFPAFGGTAAWLFVIGSAQFLARPVIRLLRNIRLKQIPESQWEY